MIRRSSPLLAVLLTGTLIVGACGGDDDEATDSTAAVTTPDTEAATDTAATEPETTTAATEPEATTAPTEPESTTAEPTGEPIKVMALGDFESAALGNSNPEWPGAVEARAESINANGGINGSPLEVIVCDTGFDPNNAAQCARDAVDQGVVAVLGLNSLLGPQIFPILEEAGIAVIGTVTIDASTLTSPVSFPIESGIPGTLFGAPQLLAAEGATKVSMIYPNVPGADGVVPLFATATQLAGIESGGTFAVEPDVADVTPNVASAVEGNDGIVSFLIGDTQGKFLQSIQQQGITAKVLVPEAFLTPDLIANLGDAIEGTYVLNQYPPLGSDVEGLDMFVADMDAHDADLAKTDQSLNNWLSTYVFEQVAKTLDTVDAASVLAAMGQLEDFDTLGLTPPYTTTTEFTALPGLNRLFNRSVIFSKFEDGKVVALTGEFVDVFAAVG